MLPQGCIESDPSGCANLRGSLFFINQSSTWSNIGLIELGLIEERKLGYSGNAQVGYDTVTLGWPGDEAPTLLNQVVEGFATKDFYTGIIGLTPHAVNLTTLNDPKPSVLGTLRAEGRISSSTWAYTAGAHYKKPDVFGSLTLGGYDTRRFVPNNVSFPFGADISRDLVVGIQSIISDSTASPLLSNTIYALINSHVPHIWLPLDVCQAFEKAFGLIWNSTSELYLVDDEMHDRLIRQNANLTFRLGPLSTSRDEVEIVMPYSSFDLTAGHPLVTNSTRYFPLKRAQNDSQYTLGRTFLQQAYLIVDYDHSNFSVSQARFPLTGSDQDIVPIGSLETRATSSESKGLSRGAVIAIAISVTTVVLLLLGLMMFILHRRRRKRAEAEGRDEYPGEELDTKDTSREPIAILDGNEIANKYGAELDTPVAVIEMPDKVHTDVHELPGELGHVHELECPPVSHPEK